MEKFGWWSTFKLSIAYALLKNVLKIKNMYYKYDYSMLKKSFGGLQSSLVYQVLKGFDITPNGLNNIANNLPYEVPIFIDKFDSSLWDESGSFIGFRDIYRKLVNNNMIVFFCGAVYFITESNNIVMNQNIIDGIDEIQEIKLDNKGQTLFTPHTFKITVKKDDDGIYHIKDRHQLTSARKMYNIPNIKRTKNK